jgi:hypothetical protein
MAPVDHEGATVSETKYRDRNKGYIPTPPREDGGYFERGEAEVNSFRRWPDGTPAPPQMARVVTALADEYNRDHHGLWQWAQVGEAGDPDGEHWSRFSGYMLQVDVELHTGNRREVNDWKGRDEIRPAGHWVLFFNRRQVCSGGVAADPFDTLLAIREKARSLLSTQVDWTDPEAIIGRKVWYVRQPAVIASLVLEQGCMMLRPVDGSVLYSNHEVPKGEDDGWSDPEAGEAKVEIDSPHVWWWRDVDFPGDSA